MESKEQIRQRLKREHSDWDDKKLAMQTGRFFQQQEAKAADEAHRKAISSQVKSDNPDLEGKALEKEINLRIQREKDQLELGEAGKLVSETRDAYEKAIFDYASLKIKVESKTSTKSSGLTKEAKDELIEKIKTL